MVFTNPQRRLKAALQVIADRAHEPPASALAAAIEEMLRYAAEDDLVTGMSATRLRLVATVPALQAAALRRVAAAAGRLTDAVHAAYPAELDEDSAAVLVGAVLGAALTASIVSLRRSNPPAEVAASVRRATAIVTRRLQSSQHGIQPEGPKVRG